MNNLSPIEKLDGIYPLFFKSCYKEIVAIGTPIRNEFRDKIYSVTRESGEAFLNEGTFKNYVLEAYERTHLSYMMALSYFKMGQEENAKIELRRANDEMNAKIYTSGSDELNLLLIANLWEELELPEEAAPNYRKIVEMTGISASTLRFARERLRLLESHGKKGPPLSPPHIFAIGDFPNVFYSGINSFNETFPMGYSMKNCTSQTGSLFNTTPWSQKISQRGNEDLSFYKKIVRTPATIFYTAAVLATGGYALVATKTTGDAAAYITIFTLGVGYRTFIMGYAPDMRYWSELPSGFLFTSKSDLTKEPCAFQYLSEKGLNPKRLM